MENAGHDHHTNQMKKFRPKYELWGLQSKPPIEYASVVITKASQPREIYIQIQDEDTPRFSEMVKDLQEEFRFTTVQSSSYCASPVVGNAYVLKSKTDGQWWRVLIELKELKRVVFFVDSGHRLHVQPGMMFHEIPDRFMEFPAQAVRCHLHSVYTRMNSFDQSIFPPEMSGFVDQYEYKLAFAFFNGWSGTDIGIAGTNSLEFSADTILYRNGDSNSINVQVCLTSTAYVISPNAERPEHHLIRDRLSATKPAGHSIIPSTMVVAFPPSSAATEDKQIAVCWVNEEKMIIIPVLFFGCQSPESIFFHTPGLMKEFLKLQNTINSYFEARKDSLSDDPINFDVGYVCAVKRLGKWCRAEVVDVDEYPEIGLTLLDNGVSIKVNFKTIRRLPAGLNQAPRTILHCTLSDVYPLSGNEWDDQVTQFVKKRIHDAERITIGWKKYPNFFSGKALPVTVYVHLKENKDALDTGPKVCLNLNEELISLGLASKSHIIGTASKTASKLVWKSRELPKVGESFTASVTWFNEKGEIFLRDSRSKVEVDYIRQTLDEKYRNTLPTKANLSCSPGDLCIAKYKDEWFRCTIREIRDNEVKIYFADCGIVGIIGINDIRMDIIMEEMPVQIMRCSLWNLKPSVGTKGWSSEEQKSILNEALKSGELLVNVKDAGPPIQVELAYKSEPEFGSFNSKMVEKGLAVFVSK